MPYRGFDSLLEVMLPDGHPPHAPSILTQTVPVAGSNRSSRALPPSAASHGPITLKNCVDLRFDVAEMFGGCDSGRLGAGVRSRALALEMVEQLQGDIGLEGCPILIGSITNDRNEIGADQNAYDACDPSNAAASGSWVAFDLPKLRGGPIANGKPGKTRIASGFGVRSNSTGFTAGRFSRSPPAPPE